MADRKNQKRMLNKFIQVFLTTFALLMIVIAIGTVVYVVVSQRNISTPVAEADFFGDTEYTGPTVVDGEIDEGPLAEKKMTTFAVFGVDSDNYRTDVNMLVFFNHETAAIDIISIPRDTRVKIPDEIYETIQQRRNDVDQIVKINEVPAYIVEDRNEVSVAVLEKSLGVDIDYYIKMDLDVFRKIVDIIGGVTFDVPFDMAYNDPEQDLFISLSKGEQTLNGGQAEQLVRFRSGYDNGDIGRIEMQHAFMKAFVNQLLTTKNRLNMLNIVGEVLMRVETNFDQAVEYLTFLEKIDPENFVMHMLPGEVENSTRSYYVYDYDATKLMLNDIINDPYRSEAEEGEAPTPETDTETVVDVVPEVIIDVKNLAVSVQNGTRVGGFAGGTGELLEGEGYNVVDISDYPEKPVARTKLMVPHEEVFEAMKAQFTNPEMILAPAMMDEEFQVVVVLGQDDGDVWQDD